MGLAGRLPRANTHVWIDRWSLRRGAALHGKDRQRGRLFNRPDAPRDTSRSCSKRNHGCQPQGPFAGRREAINTACRTCVRRAPSRVRAERNGRNRPRRGSIRTGPASNWTARPWGMGLDRTQFGWTARAAHGLPQPRHSGAGRDGPRDALRGGEGLCKSCGRGDVELVRVEDGNRSANGESPYTVCNGISAQESAIGPRNSCSTTRRNDTRRSNGRANSLGGRGPKPYGSAASSAADSGTEGLR